MRENLIDRSEIIKKVESQEEDADVEEEEMNPVDQEKLLVEAAISKKRVDNQEAVVVPEEEEAEAAEEVQKLSDLMYHLPYELIINNLLTNL